jgi:hypothetical protein
VPRGYWLKKENQLAFLKDLEQKLDIQEPSGWYNFKYEDIVNNGGKALLTKYYNSSMSKMLKTLYPDYAWDLSKYSLQTANKVNTH